MAKRFWLATRKGVFAVERNGSGWKVASVSFLGDNSSIVTPDVRDGSVYAALGLGHFGCKMHRSVDGGKNWQAIAAPKYPEYPKDKPPEINAMSGKAIPWNTELIWSIEPGGKDQPGVLWCGTIPGGLFRSEDYGQSWAMVRSLWDDPRRLAWSSGGMEFAGIHSISVDPRDSRNVTLAVSTGGVWHSADSGATWELRGQGLRAEYMPPDKQYDALPQDAHRLMHCPANPDAMWVQHHNGIFASEDCGRTFREIENVKPSAFGFAVAVHPRDGKTAWFVPAIKDEQRIPRDGKLVVTRTRDGGKTFDVLGKGLPDDHAYDIVLRHALDVDGDGKCLAMGSSTGSVWVSENEGESWETVSTHLPPVYSVRFEGK